MQVKNGLFSYLINDRDEYLYFIAPAYSITASFRSRIVHYNSTVYICSKNSKTYAVCKFLPLPTKILK